MTNTHKKENRQRYHSFILANLCELGTKQNFKSKIYKEQEVRDSLSTNSPSLLAWSGKKKKKKKVHGLSDSGLVVEHFPSKAATYAGRSPSHPSQQASESAGLTGESEGAVSPWQLLILYSVKTTGRGGRVRTVATVAHADVCAAGQHLFRPRQEDEGNFTEGVD